MCRSEDVGSCLFNLAMEGIYIYMYAEYDPVGQPLGGNMEGRAQSITGWNAESVQCQNKHFM